MTATPEEIELKFLVGPNRRGQVESMAARAPQQTLVSTYFDTPTKALHERGMVLRVRFDGKAWVQTLKALPEHGGIARGEWEWRLSSGTPDLDRARETPAAKVLPRGVRLEPQFTVTVARRAWMACEGKAWIELAFDDGEVSSAGRKERFCELEMELKSGETAALLAFAARTRRTLALTPSFKTKAERGFALGGRTGPRARRFVAPLLTAEMPAADAFRAIARAALEQIAANAEQLRDGPGPEVIHQMRVGARRLRSALATFKAVASDRRLSAIVAELKWLTGELDPARNLDVLLSGAYRRAAKRKADTLGLRDLGRRLRMLRAAAYARARSAAESERLAALIMDVVAWLEAGAWIRSRTVAAERERPIGDFAAEALKKRRDKALKAGRRLARLSRVRRHKLRIEAKKVRYAADAFQGLWGQKRRARKFIGTLKVLQDRLGELNDIATGEGLAHELVKAAADAGEADWAAGLLIGGETAREADLIRSAEAAFASFAEAKRFWPKT